MGVVLLLSRQRSGTGALVSVLERHEAIAYAGEVLDPGCDLSGFYPWVAARGVGVADPHAFCALFDGFVGEMLASPVVHIVDVKYNCLNAFAPLFHSFADMPWLLEFFSRIPVPMINLRRNPLDTFISAKLADANGIYHATRHDEIRIGAVQIDLVELGDYLDNCDREDAVIDRHFSGYGFAARLDFERLFSGQGELAADAMQAVSTLLDLDFAGVDLRPRFVRQASPRLADKIANVSEVQKFLIAGGYIAS